MSAEKIAITIVVTLAIGLVGIVWYLDSLIDREVRKRRK